MFCRSRLALIATATATTLTACAEAPSDEGLVARAGSHVWSVEQATELLTLQPELPVEPEVVRALADLWIDYTLLAAAAERDTTLATVDVSPLVLDLVKEQLVLELRDSVVTVEPLADDEFRARYVAEAPGSLVRARHIFLAWPADPTPARRDSLLRELDGVRRRVVEGGEDFAAVASEVSQDSATVQDGGTLPIFGRGQVSPELEAAAFALEPGEVSGPIESSAGLHLIQVEERLMPTVERFRSDLLARMVAAAESTYVASLEAQAQPQVVRDAAQRVRSLARNYRSPLSDTEAARPLVAYQGGAVTQGEFLWFLQAQAPELRAQVAEAPDDALPLRVLRGVAHQELLVLAALSRGWTVPPERQEEAAAAARANLVGAARQLGLLPVEVGYDELPEEAVTRVVDGLLSGMLTGAVREVTPLGPMSYILRQGSGSRVVEAGLAEVVARVQELRGGQTPPP